jgi:hypothetical protein
MLFEFHTNINTAFYSANNLSNNAPYYLVSAPTPHNLFVGQVMRFFKTTFVVEDGRSIGVKQAWVVNNKEGMIILSIPEDSLGYIFLRMTDPELLAYAQKYYPEISMELIEDTSRLAFMSLQGAIKLEPTVTRFPQVAMPTVAARRVMPDIDFDPVRIPSVGSRPTYRIVDNYFANAAPLVEDARATNAMTPRAPGSPNIAPRNTTAPNNMTMTIAGGVSVELQWDYNEYALTARAETPRQTPSRDTLSRYMRTFLGRRCTPELENQIMQGIRANFVGIDEVSVTRVPNDNHVVNVHYGTDLGARQETINIRLD